MPRLLIESLIPLTLSDKILQFFFALMIAINTI